MSYVTKDDFLKVIGIDLDIEFASGNYDVEDMPQIFINRVEDTTITTLKNNYDNENIEEKIHINLEEFKKAMVYQIYNQLKQGETGIICKQAFIKFQMLGLCNLRRY